MIYVVNFGFIILFLVYMIAYQQNCKHFKDNELLYKKGIKETSSVTMNIFRKKKSFLFKSFICINRISYVFTINMFSTAENCIEK